MKNHELTATRITGVIVMAMVISMILLLVFVGVLVLIHIYVVLRDFRRRINSVNMAERGNFGRSSMSQEDIEKLPCFDFQGKEKGISSLVDCAICLDNFKVGDKCRMLLQCNHSFHAECIDLWLLKSPFCPICRASADVLKGCCSTSTGESSRCSESGGNGRVSGDGQMRQDSSNMTGIRIELREGQEINRDYQGI
ncbi:hypothetical protein HAX54_014911 [Datura stramonium]|uniref:RING-type domain-containing protein n=1 Tax=Datura stramonium TaxID=4076 RepID=A0ABS8RZ08_DATST|nr:hypothetical protein [Datura stramonium]